MKAISHQVTHVYQPTNYSCSQAALSILLSHYDIHKTPEQLITEAAPVTQNDSGEDQGSVNQDLATWCITQNFHVSMYTFDFQIINFDWMDIPQNKLLEKMKEARGHRNVNSLGKKWSEHYITSYISFIEAGGNLTISPYPSSQLLYKILEKAPFHVGVASRLLHTLPHTKTIGLRKNEHSNTTSGQAGTHSVVVYGNDEQGNFLVADPWEKPGRHVIEPERLICAITAAELECDNLLFYLEK